MINVNNVLSAVGGFLAYQFAKFGAFIMSHQTEIAAVMLRVEKDAQDGWTNQEKEDLVVDLIFQYIYPELPIVLKIIPKSWIESIIRSSIKKICEKSHVLKDRPAEIMTATKQQ